MSDIASIENNLYGLYTIIATAPLIRKFQGKGYAYFRNPNRMWPELIYFPDPDERNPKELLVEIIQLARDGSIPPWCLPSPAFSSPELIQGLRNMQFYEGNWKGMVWTPQLLKPFEQKRLQIEVLENPEHLPQWLSLVGPHLLGEAVTSPELFQYLFHRPETEFYVGLIDQNIISASMVFVHEGVMGLYFMVTHPNYQRQGIGSEMVQTVQNQARELQVKSLVLQATNAGFPLYQNQGFQTVATFNMFNLLQYQREMPFGGQD